MSGAWLEQRVAVVTGASQGIGRAIAEGLAGAGAHVFAAARSQSLLQELEGTIAARGGMATAVVCDVSRADEVERLFTLAEAAGDPTVLVCAAGILRKAPFDAITNADWDAVLGVNLTGTFLCCRRAFAPMRRAGGGRIVNFGSLSGVYATEKFPGLTAYNVSKYGVIGLTEAIAVEGREHAIVAISVSPGAVNTEMLRQANAELKAGLQPDDVAHLVISLLDGAIAPASGANIPLFSNL